MHGTGEFDPDREAARVAWQQALQDLGNRQFDDRAALLPALAMFARERDPSFTQLICKAFDANPQTDPAVPLLDSACTKAVFAFTNPEDYTDTLSDTKLGELLSVAFDMAVREAAEHGLEPNLQATARYANFLAGHLLMIKFAMQDAGELEGVAPDDQYDLAMARFETITQALQTDDNGPLEQ